MWLRWRATAFSNGQSPRESGLFSFSFFFLFLSRCLLWPGMEAALKRSDCVRRASPSGCSDRLAEHQPAPVRSDRFSYVRGNRIPSREDSVAFLHPIPVKSRGKAPLFAVAPLLPCIPPSVTRIRRPFSFLNPPPRTRLRPTHLPVSPIPYVPRRHYRELTHIFPGNDPGVGVA